MNKKINRPGKWYSGLTNRAYSCLDNIGVSSKKGVRNLLKKESKRLINYKALEKTTYDHICEWAGLPEYKKNKK